ncbi:MAG: bifunctional enoyl-CoA hydratase/phosphate acetyltransferase [Bacillota bacterium]
MFENIDELIEAAKSKPSLKLAVAAAGDKVVLESVKKADEAGIIDAVLVGDQKKIKNNLQKLDYDFNGEIVHADNDKEAANKSIELIAEGKADFPMKGLLSTKVILQALLDKKYDLRQDRLLSLVTMMYLENEDKIVFMTDGGMNIAPDLNDKKEIITNAAEMAQAVGVKKPKVAPLAAVEKVNSAMPCTLDAATLSKMGDRGQIGNVEIDGPLAFDNAVSLEAAEHKGIESPVAGQADILLVPDIEAGNILYKALVFYAGLPSASLVLGAKVPMVLTSRADSATTKFNSIALGKLVTMGYKNN